jgi:hypothetical protein
MSTNKVELTRDEECTTSIMRRVKVIYFWRNIISQLTTPLALEAVLFVVFVTVINLSISISHVYENMSQLSYFGEGVSYLYDATLHTRLSIQLVLGASLILAAFMGREVYRNIRGWRGSREGKMEFVQQ